MLCIDAVSIASSSVIGGWIPGSRVASMVLPVPGGHGPDPARDPEPSRELRRGEPLRGYLPGRGEDADRDRQVEPPAFLRKVRGQEVHRDAPRGKLEMPVLNAARTRSRDSRTS